MLAEDDAGCRCELRNANLEVFNALDELYACMLKWSLLQALYIPFPLLPFTLGRGTLARNALLPRPSTFGSRSPFTSSSSASSTTP